MAHLIVLDSVTDDIFVCGMCKTVFNSLELFLDHKKKKCDPDNFECVLTNENVSSENALQILTSIPQAESIDSTESSCVPSENLGENALLILTGIPQAESIDSTESSCVPGENLGENALRNATSVPQPESADFTESSCVPGENALQNATSVPQAESTDFTESSCVTVANEFTCTVCRKKYKNKRGLTTHKKSHFEKPYQCLICGRCFTQNSHLQRHIVIHKVWPESLSETTPKYLDVGLMAYSCPYCTTTFCHYSKFRSHLSKHQSFKKFKCIQGDCKDFFDTLEKLLHHVSCNHVTQIYACHVCNEPFNSLHSIASHEVGHTELERSSSQPKPYKCNQCDAVFTKPEKLSLHMITENHKKVCIHCKKTFASDKRLRVHLKIHSNLKPFVCDICNAGFHMKKYLVTHMLKHGAKAHRCHVCEYSFNRIDLLRRHMITHSPDKLQCPYRDSLNCKRVFSRSDKLKLHIKRHS